MTALLPPSPLAARPVPRLPSGTLRRASLGAFPLMLPLTVALSAGGCGNKSTLSVRVVAPPGVADPFIAATTVRMTFKDQQTTANVTSGKFEISLEIDQPPDSEYVQLAVEAIDGSGQIVGRGRTPNFVYQAVQDDLAVYVGRPGQVTATDLRLPDDQGSQSAPIARTALAGASLRGRLVTPVSEPSLGALIVGGVGDVDGGIFPTRAWLYKPATHSLVDAGKPMQSRRGAVLLPSSDANAGQQAIYIGGSDPTDALLGNVDKFDPQVATLSSVWASPAMGLDDARPGAYAPSACEPKDNVFVVSGGTKFDHRRPDVVDPLDRAWLVRRNAGTDATVNLGVTRIDPTMKAPRARHSASKVTVGDGAAALLFGGLSPDGEAAMLPVAELYLVEKNQFQELALSPVSQPAPALPSRRSHAAFTLRTGRVFIAGGYAGAETAKQTLGSVLVIDAQAKTYELRETAEQGSLKTPRYAASIAQVGDELVLCGGYNAAGEPVADCELFNIDTGQPTRAPTPLPTARAEHLAIGLENDKLLLVGGIGPDKRPLASIDIYTAR